MRTVVVTLGLMSVMIAGVANACPSGTCPVEPSATAKPSAGQASQPLVFQAPPARDDSAPAIVPIQTADVQPSGDYLQKQAFDCADFQRHDDGGWAAVRAVSFPAPEGPLKVETGSVYRPGQFAGGYDLGAMLEHDCPR